MALIYQKYDTNILIDILYISLILLFLSSKYLVLNNIQNAKEFSYIIFISFYLSLRLITIPFSRSKILSNKPGKNPNKYIIPKYSYDKYLFNKSFMRKKRNLEKQYSNEIEFQKKW